MMNNLKNKKPFFSATRKNSIRNIPAYQSFLHRTRFLLFALLFVFNFIIYNNSILINFLIFFISNQNQIQIQHQNLDFDRNFSDFNWTQNNFFENEFQLKIDNFQSELFKYSTSQKSILFSFAAFGTFINFLPIRFLTTKFGFRRVSSASGLFSSFFIAFLPFSINFGFYFLAFNQFLQGCTLSSSILLIPNVIKKWSTRKNDHFCFVIVTIFFQISPFFIFPLSSHLSTSFFGWQTICYFQSILTVFITILFFYFFKENPERHGNVSNVELARIDRDRIRFNKKYQLSIEKMLKSPQFQSIITNIFIYFLLIQFFIQFLSFYLQNIGGIQTNQTSWTISIFMIIHVILKIILCRIFEKKSKLVTLKTIQLLTFCSLFAISILFVLLIFFKFEIWIQICAFLLISMSASIFWTTISKSSNIISDHFYCSIIQKIILKLYFLSGILSSLLGAILLPNFDSAEHFRHFFIFFAILLIFSAIFFISTFRLEKCDWEKTLKHSKTTSADRLGSEGIAPVSHPRPAQFSTTFDDSIVVSIISLGLERCDTCRKHGINSKFHSNCIQPTSASSSSSFSPNIPTRQMFDDVFEPVETMIRV